MTSNPDIRARWIFILIPLAFSCSPQPVDHGTENGQAVRENLIRANRQFVRRQLNDIDGYIERKGYRMDSTETGLRYHIEREGTGPRPGAEQTVTVRYRTELLDGRNCYDSDSLGPLRFHMSYDEAPNGLREGVGMMAAGDKALLILPAHLAYGLTGDHDCIPPNAALVMQVELIRIE